MELQEKPPEQIIRLKPLTKSSIGLLFEQMEEQRSALRRADLCSSAHVLVQSFLAYAGLPKGHEEGPYVLVDEQVLPTYLSAFIDCHSRYVVEARYYLRQNLNILIDSLIRGMTAHGAPGELYLDNAKVYLANALKAACYRLNIKLRYRPVRDPAAGGLIERFFQTVQSQFEAEVRAQEVLTLDKLNRGFSAWLSVQYHQNIHSETKEKPQERYQAGLPCIRQVDMQEFLTSFLQRVPRTVNKTFSDIRLWNRFYKVDPKLRGDRVEIRFDPFGTLDSVQIYSIRDESFLGQGTLHHRQTAEQAPASSNQGPPKHNYIDLLVNEHDHKLNQQAQGIDYTRLRMVRSWSFQAFVKKLALLMGEKAGLTSFLADELETLKKFFNRNPQISETSLVQAYQKAQDKSLPYILYELQQLSKEQ